MTRILRPGVFLVTGCHVEISRTSCRRVVKGGWRRWRASREYQRVWKKKGWTFCSRCIFEELCNLRARSLSSKQHRATSECIIYSFRVPPYVRPSSFPLLSLSLSLFLLSSWFLYIFYPYSNKARRFPYRAFFSQRALSLCLKSKKQKGENAVKRENK